VLGGSRSYGPLWVDLGNSASPSLLSPAAAASPNADKPGIACQGGIYCNTGVGLRAMCWPRPQAAHKPEAVNENSPPEPAKRPNVSHQSSFHDSDHRDGFRGVRARWTCQWTRAGQCAQSHCAERQYRHLQETGHRAGGWAGQPSIEEIELSIRSHTNADRTATHVIWRLRARWAGSPTERESQCTEDRDAKSTAPHGGEGGKQRSRSFARVGGCPDRPEQASLEAIRKNPFGTGRPLNPV
jgi:hypothetical protein